MVIRLRKDSTVNNAASREQQRVDRRQSRVIISSMKTLNPDRSDNVSSPKKLRPKSARFGDVRLFCNLYRSKSRQ